jgi:hypothetical protein
MLTGHIMNAFPAFSTLTLPARAMYSLQDAEGLQLTCTEGSLWVTLDNDLRDIVLGAGDSFTLPDRRRAIVYALDASRLTQRPRTGPAPALVPTPAKASSARRGWLTA